MLECGEEADEAEDIRGELELGEGEPESLERLGLYWWSLLVFSLMLTGERRRRAPAEFPIEPFLKCSEDRDPEFEDDGSGLSQSCPNEFVLEATESLLVLDLN